MASDRKKYRKRMFGSKHRCKCKNYTICEKGDACYYKKAKFALDRAHEIRKFEIELLWKRATYAAIFQTLLFAALGVSLTFDNAESITYIPWGLSFTSDNTEPIIFIFQIIICIAGIFTSFYWCLINIGSKFWHENWTHHIDFLEDEFEGKLHKTILHDEGRLPFSVSRVNIFISKTFFITWCVFALILALNFVVWLDPVFSYPLYVKILTFMFPVMLVSVILLWCRCELKTKFKDTYTERKIYRVRRKSAGHIKESPLIQTNNRRI